MAEIMMNVPLFAQTKTMTCWFAAAQMVKCYRDPNATVTALPEFYQQNLGLGSLEVTKLANVEGFRIIQFVGQKFTIHSLIAILSRFGPLWANTTAGGGQHAIVLTGASNNGQWEEAFFNDPGPVGQGQYDSMPLDKLNQYLGSQLLYDPDNGFNETRP